MNIDSTHESALKTIIQKYKNQSEIINIICQNDHNIDISITDLLNGI